MNNPKKPPSGLGSTAKPGPFDGHWHQNQMANERNVTTRALQMERRAGKGPPWLRVGRNVYYPIAGWQQWLREQERHPPRRRAG
jgi:hypothetical protein